MIATAETGIAGSNSVAAIVEQVSTSKNRFAAPSGASSGSGNPRVNADADSAVPSFKIPANLAVDIENVKNKLRSAELHSRVMRNIATDVELAEYRSLRKSRTMAVRSKTILADYTELQRMAEIEQKLSELKLLFRPIPR